MLRSATDVLMELALPRVKCCFLFPNHPFCCWFCCLRTVASWQRTMFNHLFSQIHLLIQAQLWISLQKTTFFILTIQSTINIHAYHMIAYFRFSWKSIHLLVCPQHTQYHIFHQQHRRMNIQKHQTKLIATYKLEFICSIHVHTETLQLPRVSTDQDECIHLTESPPTRNKLYSTNITMFLGGRFVYSWLRILTCSIAITIPSSSTTTTCFVYFLYFEHFFFCTIVWQQKRQFD